MGEYADSMELDGDVSIEEMDKDGYCPPCYTHPVTIQVSMRYSLILLLPFSRTHAACHSVNSPTCVTPPNGYPYQLGASWGKRRVLPTLCLPEEVFPVRYTTADVSDPHSIVLARWMARKNFELLTECGGPYLVTLCVVSLHVGLDTALRREGGMLPGRLGEERVKLVEAEMQRHQKTPVN